MRIRAALATALAVTALAVTVPLGGPAANAATPPKHNVLASFCTPHHHRDCVTVADDDSRHLVIRNHAGRRIDLTNPRRAVRYLTVHATPCAQEDSAACFWNAGSRGNHVGVSFIVIGGHAEGTGTLAYLQDVTTGRL